MAIQAPSRPLVTRVAGVLLGAAWVLTLPAAAFLPCGPTDAKNWCVDESMLDFIPGADTHVGASLAFGDFDGDGFDDLAVGAPGAVEDGGFVRVFYSNGSFLDIADRQGLSQLHGAAGDGGFGFGDRFGFALASGDFGDGFDDLAVGSPGEGLPAIAPSDCTVPTCERAGGIHVFYGSDVGLKATEPTFLHAGDVFTGPGDGPFEDEAFGAALAAGTSVPSRTASTTSRWALRATPTIPVCEPPTSRRGCSEHQDHRFGLLSLKDVDRAHALLHPCVGPWYAGTPRQDVPQPFLDQSKRSDKEEVRVLLDIQHLTENAQGLRTLVLGPVTGLTGFDVDPLPAHPAGAGPLHGRAERGQEGRPQLLARPRRLLTLDWRKAAQARARVKDTIAEALGGRLPRAYAPEVSRPNPGWCSSMCTSATRRAA